MALGAQFGDIFVDVRARSTGLPADLSAAERELKASAGRMGTSLAGVDPGRSLNFAALGQGIRGLAQMASTGNVDITALMGTLGGLGRSAGALAGGPIAALKGALGGLVTSIGPVGVAAGALGAGMLAAIVIANNYTAAMRRAAVELTRLGAELRKMDAEAAARSAARMPVIPQAAEAATALAAAQEAAKKVREEAATTSASVNAQRESLAQKRQMAAAAGAARELVVPSVSERDMQDQLAHDEATLAVLRKKAAARDAEVGALRKEVDAYGPLNAGIREAAAAKAAAAAAGRTDSEAELANQAALAQAAERAAATLLREAYSSGLTDAAIQRRGAAHTEAATASRDAEKQLRAFREKAAKAEAEACAKESEYWDDFEASIAADMADDLRMREQAAATVRQTEFATRRADIEAEAPFVGEAETRRRTAELEADQQRSAIEQALRSATEPQVVEALRAQAAAESARAAARLTAIAEREASEFLTPERVADFDRERRQANRDARRLGVAAPAAPGAEGGRALTAAEQTAQNTADMLRALHGLTIVGGGAAKWGR